MADPADQEQPEEPAGDGNCRQEETGRDGQPPFSALPDRQLSPSQIEAIREAFVGNEAEASRFSLWGLLGIVSGASLILAVGSYLPKPVFAGAVGIATLVSMVALSAMKRPPGILQVGWWTLLVIYLMAIFSAILG